jgi:hypothetical protein
MWRKEAAMSRKRWWWLERAVILLAIALLFLALPSSGGVPVAAGTRPGPVLSLWWLILAVPLVAHGLAHLAGWVAPYTQRSVGFVEQPWVFGPAGTPHSRAGRAFGWLWLAAAVALVAAGLGLLLGQGWWAFLALGAAALSLADILIWWRAVPVGARVGAAFDVVVVLAALQAAPL